MSEESEIDLHQTPKFKKTFKNLSNRQKDLVDDEIDKIAEDPNIGDRKNGDLSHMWVYKFRMDNQEVLLGYSWNENRLVITLMDRASCEFL